MANAINPFAPWWSLLERRWRGNVAYPASPPPPPPPSEPPDPSTTSVAPGVWFDYDNGIFQDAGATVPAVAPNDPIARWNSRVGTNQLVQTTAGNRPVWQTDGVSFAAINAFLALNTSLVLGSSNFTIYFVGYGGTASDVVGQVMIPLGTGVTALEVAFTAVPLVSLNDNAGGGPYTGDVGTTAYTPPINYLVRVTRTSGTVITVSATGGRTGTINPASTSFTFTGMGIDLLTPPHNRSALNRYKTLIVYASAFANGGADDTIVRNWLNWKYGLGLT